MNKFDYDVLQKAIGQKIQVFKPDTDEQIAELTITSVEKSKNDGKEFSSFSVELAGSEEEHCQQGNYKLKSDVFGEETLFMCPHAVDKYQIIVSRKAE